MWSKLLLKALLIMLVPLQFGISSLVELLYLPLNGLLFTPWVSEYYYLAQEQTLQVAIGIIGKNFLIGLMLALPAILFNYRISKSPVNKPIRRLAIAALLLSSLMIPIVLFLAVPLLGTSYYYNYVLFANLQSFPTLAIGVFVILPMIQRQAVLVASPEEMQGSTPKDLEAHPQLRVGREVNLATVLWASLYFLPYLMVPPYTYYYGGTFEVVSFACIMEASYGPSIFAEYYLISIHGTVVPLSYLPIFGIFSSLRFVFVRDIYRYLKHQITYRRLLYLGILADLFPVIALTVMPGAIYPWFPFTIGVFPVPGFVVVGMLVTRLHRSVLPVANRIWADVEAKMWFEKEERRRGVAPAPEQPSHLEDEIITVPLTYMMVSHIRKRRYNNNSRRSDEE